MLIGISGKMGAGKDLVGKIIQYLSLPEHEVADFNTFLKEYNKDTWDTPFEIKKFADAIKDMACIILGCTRDQLEDREFKEKELGEEWTKYYATRRGFTTKTEISKSMIKDYSEAEDEDDLGPMYLIEKEVLTPRKILQLLGTEAGRDTIHPNIWVNASLHKYQPSEKVRPISKENKAKYPIGMAPDNEIGMEYPKWIFTDVRFSNEAEAIKKKGGILIRVNRDSEINFKYRDFEVKQKLIDMGYKYSYNDDYTEDAINEGFKYSKQLGKWSFDEDFFQEHSSETALDNYLGFDYNIDNNGTIEELIEKIRPILQSNEVPNHF